MAWSYSVAFGKWGNWARLSVNCRSKMLHDWLDRFAILNVFRQFLKTSWAKTVLEITQLLLHNMCSYLISKSSLSSTVLFSTFCHSSNNLFQLQILLCTACSTQPYSPAFQWLPITLFLKVLFIFDKTLKANTEKVAKQHIIYEETTDIFLIWNHRGWEEVKWHFSIT